MNYDNIPANILGKIKALIEFRDHEHTSQIEAENAAMKIQAILLKHNLDESQVKDGMNAAKVQVKESELDLGLHTNIREGQWLVSLYSTISSYNLCKVVLTKNRQTKHPGHICIMGIPLNIEIVMYTVEQLANKIRVAEKSAYKQTEGTFAFNPNHNAFRRAFYDGAVKGINAKLREQTRVIVDSTPGMGLMIQRSNKEVAEYMDNKYANGLKRSKGSSYGDHAGSAMGFATGKGMDINRGVGTSSKGRLLG